MTGVEAGLHGPLGGVLALLEPPHAAAARPSTAVAASHTLVERRRIRDSLRSNGTRAGARPWGWIGLRRVRSTEVLGCGLRWSGQPGCGTAGLRMVRSTGACTLYEPRRAASTTKGPVTKSSPSVSVRGPACCESDRLVYRPAAARR